MRRLLPLLLLLSAACGSSSGNRPADVAKPDIDVRQTSSIFFGSSGITPVSLEVHITNRSGVPLRVREIQLRSTGMMQYGIRPMSKLFNETIAPGESSTLGITATAEARPMRAPSSEPLSVQAIVRFEANGRGFREVIMEQFAGSGM